MHIHAFSPMEIVYGVELTGMPLADYLSMLRDNGLGTLPGTAAEILDDEIATFFRPTSFPPRSGSKSSAPRTAAASAPLRR
jgi:FO synthase